MLYFFDTSALAKLFHIEDGTSFVTKIFQDQRNSLLVSRLALVELHSVAAIKVRTGAMTADRADLFLADVAAIVAGGRVVIQKVQDEDYEQAGVLLRFHAQKHGLRTLDALHLASALRRRARSGVDIFVTGDHNLGVVATLEGFAVAYPEEKS